jgi:hypothetical protein
MYSLGHFLSVNRNKRHAAVQANEIQTRSLACPLKTHHSTNNTGATTPASTAFRLVVMVKDSVLHADTTA